MDGLRQSSRRRVAKLTRAEVTAMLFSLLRLLGILTREKPETQQMRGRCRVTLDMNKVRPGMSEGDAINYLMKLGFSPTAKPNVWKADENYVARLPKACVLKSEKL